MLIKKARLTSLNASHSGCPQFAAHDRIVYPPGGQLCTPTPGCQLLHDSLVRRYATLRWGWGKILVCSHSVGILFSFTRLLDGLHWSAGATWVLTFRSNTDVDNVSMVPRWTSKIKHEFGSFTTRLSSFLLSATLAISGLLLPNLVNLWSIGCFTRAVHEFCSGRSRFLKHQNACVCWWNHPDNGKIV